MRRCNRAAALTNWSLIFKVIISLLTLYIDHFHWFISSLPSTALIVSFLLEFDFLKCLSSINFGVDSSLPEILFCLNRPPCTCKNKYNCTSFLFDIENMYKHKMTLLMLYAHPKNRPKNKQSKTKQSIKAKSGDWKKNCHKLYSCQIWETPKKLLMLNPWHAIVDSIGWISAI